MVQHYCNLLFTPPTCQYYQSLEQNDVLQNMYEKTRRQNDVLYKIRMMKHFDKNTTERRKREM